MLVPVEEGWDADNHLKDEDSKRPPIHGEIMAVSDEHLRCQVLGRSTERVSKFALLDELCEAKVGN